jgi:NAD(P)-dependent dehydrogenase (short-subunit alcohol dehydrogenase family)
MTEPWLQGPVLVTGGTGLIGLAIARAFAAVGARVAVLGAAERRTAEAAAALAQFTDRVRALAIDLGTPALIETAFDAIEPDWGPIAVLVNGAGINFNRAITAVTLADFDRLMAVNVRAAFFASRLAGERMAAAGLAGRIINITSGNYRYARPDAALYCATKAALEMLTRAFALEYGSHGITVNAVAPGLVARPGQSDAAYLRVAEYYQGASPLARLVQPEDVAAAVLFLASARAAAITGDTIVVDSGFSAGRFDFPRRAQ